MQTTVDLGGRWTLAAPATAIRDVVVDLEHWVAWWPQILAVASLGPDDARVLARSTLPHRLDLVVHAVCRDLPELAVQMGGDLEGHARWRLTERGDGTTDLDYRQRVTARGALGLATRVAPAVMRWNHDRMMEGCVTGLRARLGIPATPVSPPRSPR